MYDYLPKRQNNVAHLVSLALLLLSVASFVTSALVPNGLRVIPQAIGLVLLVPLIQIVSRYIVIRYLYRLCPYEDGNTDIEVYAYRGGSRMQLVCRVGLEEITGTAPLSEKNRKPPSGLRRYNYAPDMRPKEGLVLSITNADGDCEVLLCPDEFLAKALTKPPKTEGEATE